MNCYSNIDAEEVIDQFTKTICIDRVKCVKVFPINLVSFSTKQKMMSNFFLCEPLWNIHG